MTKYSTLANEIWPHLLPKVQRASGNGGNGGGGGGGSAPTLLSQLTDVQLTALSDGQFLAYESSISKWINVAAPGGGGGGSYTAGWGIDISGGSVISVDVLEITDLNSGLEVSANKIAVNLQAPAGLVANSSGLAIDDNLAGNGLNISGKVMYIHTAPGGGLTVDSTGLFIFLDSPSGLAMDTGGLRIRDDIAGNGLDISGKILFVGAGNGITVGIDSVAVNQDFNFTWTGTHSHSALSTFNGGATFNSGVFRFNTDPQINANLHFLGPARSITSAATLTLSPTGNLHLDPSANITMPNAQTYRSTTINDLPTGIDGVNIFNRSDFSPLYVQMTIGAFKADELHVRIFTADETRINRAEEYWSKSFGIVQEDFSVPGIGINVDVWFEDAPAMPGANLFAANDWLLMRSINWGTGLIVSKVWFQVVGTKLAQQTTAVHGVDRQQWRLVRRAGGWTTTGASTKVKAGNVMLDAGQVGQGWVHLSALANDGGPFIQFGKMTSISTTPLHSNYVRIGNLKNAVGYSVDTWGMAAGNNLGLDPNLGGFKGFVIEGEQGLSLYNTDIHLYDGATRVLGITNVDGYILANDVEGVGDERRSITWYDDLDNATELVPRSGISNAVYSGGGGVRRQMEIYVTARTDNAESHLVIHAMEPSAERFSTLTLRTRETLSTGVVGGYASLAADEVYLGDRVRIGSSATGSIAVLQLIESSAAVNQLAGFTIQQKTTGSVGDAVMHWHLSVPNRYYSMGIDNSDGDKFKISASASLGTSDFFSYDPATGLVTVSGLTGGPGGGGGTYTAGSGITITGTEIAVNSTVVRTTQSIIAGPGLTGGGGLTGDVNLSVNAGAGLALVSGVPGAAVRINLATGSGLNTDSGLSIDDSLAGSGMTFVAPALNVNALGTGGLETGPNEIHIKLPAVSGLETDTTGLWVRRRDNSTLNSGIHIDAGGLVLATSMAGAGLEWTTTTERILQIAVGGGLEFNDATDDALLRVMLPANSGLLRDGTGIYLNPTLAGAGLLMTSGVIDVGAGNGITVGTDAITIKLRTVSPGSGMVVSADGLSIQRRGSAGLTSGLGMNVTDGVFLADTVAGAGLEWTTSTERILQISVGGGIEYNDATVDANVRVKLPTNSGLVRDTTGLYIDDIAGAGMTMDGAKKLNVNAANTSITVAADDLRVNYGHDFPWGGDHTFSTGQVTFNTTPNVSANLHFIAANRSITTGSTYMLTLAPGGDLKLDPTGLILLPTVQELRSETYNDFVAGIEGIRHWHIGGNHRQITINKMKVDELYARVFTADEARVNRGEEFWARSFGIVETAFVVPADEADVDVWFEEVPGLGFAAKLFLPDHWIQFRTIDWGTGLVIQAVWFLVVDAGASDWVARQAKTDTVPARQQWRLKRKSGGFTGAEIAAGNVGVDFGQPFTVTTPLPGQGVVHLSALAQDGGPFVQIQTFESVLDGVPQFDNRVRMGNLSGTVDYTVDTWGFAAGNDLGIVPGAGFSGLVADATSGMRLFNTDIAIYGGATKVLLLDRTDGLAFRYGAGSGSPTARIDWVSDVDDIGGRIAAGYYSNIQVHDTAGLTRMDIAASHVTGIGSFRVLTNSAGSSLLLTMEQDYIDFSGGSPANYWRAKDGRFQVGGTSALSTASPLHVYENTSSTGATTGLTIEQDGAGDAAMQFYLTGTPGSYWSIGIDNSATGDPFKIAPAADLASHVFHLTAAGTLTLAGGLALSGSLTGVTALEVTGAVNLFGALSVAGASSLASPVTVGTGVGASTLAIDGAATSLRQFAFRSAGSNRWIWTVDAVAESGGSVGSDLALWSRNDSGVGISNVVITAERLTGNIGMGRVPVAGVNLAVLGTTMTPTLQGTTIANGNLTLEGTSSGTKATSYLLLQPGGGLVGIGTSTPTTLLHLLSSSTAGTIARVENDAAAGYANMRAQNDAGGFFQFTAWGSTFGGSSLGMTRAGRGMLIWGGTATDMVIGTDTAGALVLSTNATRRMTISSGGLVGIGEPSPVAQLDIQQTPSEGLRVSAFAQAAAIVGRRANGSGTSQVVNTNELLVIGSQGYTSSGWPAAASYSGSIRFFATESHTSTAKGTMIEFYTTGNSSASPITAMTLLNSGRVNLPIVYSYTTSVVPNMVIGTAGELQRTTHVNSSLRYKEQVESLSEYEYSGLFAKLNPVSYFLKAEHGGDGRKRVGLIAEEVEAAGGADFIQYDDEGRPDVVLYDRLLVMLIAEMRKMQRRMLELEGSYI